MDANSFGAHVRRLREARRLTQEALAARCDLAADTIRRLEHGSFSPSLDTLRKLVAGLGLRLSTLFEGFELGEASPRAELIDLLSSRSPGELRLAIRVLRALFDEPRANALGQSLALQCVHTTDPNGESFT